jgi:hypothetical protein
VRSADQPLNFVNINVDYGIAVRFSLGDSHDTDAAY